MSEVVALGNHKAASDQGTQGNDVTGRRQKRGYSMNGINDKTRDAIIMILLTS